ncbi:MAG: diacylglycerol kinase family protein [Anaerolineales bacterium]|nr:diacylglycerol kinase family protein [Anaerolineales bacterium]
MKAFFSSRLHSFRYAFHGWHHVLRTQRNAWIHSGIATAVFIVGLWLKIPPRDWAVIILTAALVFTAEFLNTSIEAVVDLVSPDHHPLAKIGKDVGAAAVLVSALAAIIIGLLLLGPPFWQKLTTLIPNP